ncbi:unnamed protein product [Aureobasidium mustum]|uniref:Uncharacterized protein n=1 Tax=Aureobasidium mustum TaxID=2773714 RepID=A0A9N8PAU1_9PEZI|nr:unnamed protein product [Aureobasidium mustum]
MASRFDVAVHRARQEDLSIFFHHHNWLTDIRLHERFPRGSDYQTAKPALKWYRTIDGRVAVAFEGLRITDLWNEQLSLIDLLSRGDIFSIIPTELITRPCRLAAMIMQVCAEVSLQKARNFHTPITEEEIDVGTFAHPYQLVLVADDDIDPAVWMDAYTLAHDTGVKLSTPTINITYPGDEYQYLTNADVVFASIDRIKKLVGTKAIGLSCVRRIIVDEPLYINKTTWGSLAMLLRHPEMNPEVGTLFVGRAASLEPEVVKKIRDFTTHTLPYWHEHTAESRAEAQAEWDAYEATI